MTQNLNMFNKKLRFALLGEKNKSVKSNVGEYHL